MLKMHPQLLHFDTCRNAHILGDNGELIENIHEGYDYKPCISTFMSSCVSLKSKNEVTQILTSEKCPFLNYEDGSLHFSNVDGFDDIADILIQCKTIFSYLDILHDFVLGIVDDVENHYVEELKFLSDADLKSKIINLLKMHKVCGKSEFTSHYSFLCFSFFSSIIEKLMQMILVDVCGSEYEHPPTFSDLLTHEKIEEIFDKKFLNFIRLTLAHPGGLNLRNLLWHGFISQSHDFDDRYTSLTFLILMTILKDQKNLKSLLDQEKFKNWVSFSQKRISSRIDILKRTYNYTQHGEKLTMNEIEELCRHSYFLAPDRLELVISSFRELLHNEKNGGQVNFLYLIIPQIEHLLRRIYIYTNKLDPNLLLAKSREFFTIIDDILSFEIRTKNDDEEGEGEEEEEEDLKATKPKNYLWREIGWENHNKCLDLFYLSEGLRIRDIIAHSEIHPSKIPPFLSDRIYEITINLLSHFDIRRTVEKRSEMCKKVARSIEYPIFHPKTRFLEMIESVGEYFCESYTKKRNIDKDDDLSNVLKNVKEISGFECLWTRKLFSYRKVKNKPTSQPPVSNKKKKKKNAVIEYFSDEVFEFLSSEYTRILDTSKNRGILEQLMKHVMPPPRTTNDTNSNQENVSSSSNFVDRFIDIMFKYFRNEDARKKKYKRIEIIEDHSISFEIRKKVLNNIGVARKICDEEMEIMKLYESKFDNLVDLIRTRKARTSQRKNFGCLVRTKRLFSKMIEIQILQVLDVLVASFLDVGRTCSEKVEEEEEEEKVEEEEEEYPKMIIMRQDGVYHKKLMSVYTTAIRLKLGVESGKMGMVIKEFIFNFLNISDWMKKKRDGK